MGQIRPNITHKDKTEQGNRKPYKTGVTGGATGQDGLQLIKPRTSHVTTVDSSVQDPGSSEV
jgi:hypothetical protein